MPDSSPEEVVDQTASADTHVEDSSVAESSTAEVTAGSMLDTVKAALGQKEASPASESTGEQADKADSEPNAEDDDDKDELSPEELKAVARSTAARFKKLTSKLAVKDEELNALRPKAEEFEKINRFVTDAGLTNQEVGQILTIGALMKSDPAEALKALMPYVQRLQDAVGEVLDPDLQERVRLGYLTEADARELSKAQATARNAQQRAERMTERQRQEAEQREVQRLIDSGVKAAGEWEAKQATRDPDWHLKRTEVAEKVELAIARKAREVGRPWFPNAEEAVGLAQSALKEVNARFKTRVSRPSEVRPVTGSASNRTTAAPQSMLDVVRNAIAAG